MPEDGFDRGTIRPVECLKEGFELLRNDYWLLFAVWLVGGLISTISFLIVSGAMTAGIFYCYLKKIDGENVSFDDLWKGMKWFFPGLLVMALVALPMILVYAVIYVPVILSAVMGARLSQEELMAMLIGALVVDAVLIVIMVCIHSLLIFTFPLMVDRDLGPVKSMLLSARAVFGNLAGVAGLLGLNFLLAVAGYLAFCIGIYFVVPILIAGTVVAYRKIFPRPGRPVLSA